MLGGEITLGELKLLIAAIESYMALVVTFFHGSYIFPLLDLSFQAFF